MRASDPVSPCLQYVPEASAKTHRPARFNALAYSAIDNVSMMPPERSELEP